MIGSRKDIIRATTFYKNLENLDEKNIDEFKSKELDKRCAGTIYKFIQFDDDIEKNRMKLETLFDRKLWFGCPWTMNDSTEFIMPSNTEFNSENEKEGYEVHCDCLYEMYVLCSFSTTISENMWSEYSNNGNGICLVFNVLDYDYFYPVEYVKNKKKYSFVPAWRRMMKNYLNAEFGMLPNLSSISLAPFFIKDKVNPDTGNDSSLEKEIRAVYCMYSEDGINQGILIPGYCKENEIYGTAVDWEMLNLSLSKVIFGYKLADDVRLKIMENLGDTYTYSFAPN